MTGTPRDSISDRVANEVASVLRHDLVTPINLIVGYCDLLMIETTERGETARLAPLRSIRSSGFAMLHLIDQTLLTDQPDRSVADLEELAQAMGGPAAALVRTCDNLSDSIDGDASRSDFIDDLRKIRAAGLQMIEMAKNIAQGRPLEADGSRFPLGG